MPGTMPGSSDGNDEPDKPADTSPDQTIGKVSDATTAKTGNGTDGEPARPEVTAPDPAPAAVLDPSGPGTAPTSPIFRAPMTDTPRGRSPVRLDLDSAPNWTATAPTASPGPAGGRPRSPKRARANSQQGTWDMELEMQRMRTTQETQATVIKDLQAELERLKEKNATLASRCDQLEADKSALAGRCDKLEAEMGDRVKSSALNNIHTKLKKLDNIVETHKTEVKQIVNKGEKQQRADHEYLREELRNDYAWFKDRLYKEVVPQVKSTIKDARTELYTFSAAAQKTSEAAKRDHTRMRSTLAHLRPQLQSFQTIMASDKATQRLRLAATSLESLVISLADEHKTKGARALVQEMNDQLKNVQVVHLVDTKSKKNKRIELRVSSVDHNALTVLSKYGSLVDSEQWTKFIVDGIPKDTPIEHLRAEIEAANPVELACDPYTLSRSTDDSTKRAYSAVLAVTSHDIYRALQKSGIRCIDRVCRVRAWQTPAERKASLARQPATTSPASAPAPEVLPATEATETTSPGDQPAAQNTTTAEPAATATTAPRSDDQ